MALVQCGALWPALSAMFGYDYTLEEGGVVTTAGASSQVKLIQITRWGLSHIKILLILQAVANRLARLSLLACAALSGFPPSSPLPSPTSKDAKKDDEPKIDYPSNPVAQRALERLLTPYIAHQLGKTSPDQV